MKRNIRHKLGFTNTEREETKHSDPLNKSEADKWLPVTKRGNTAGRIYLLAALLHVQRGKIAPKGFTVQSTTIQI